MLMQLIHFLFSSRKKKLSNLFLKYVVRFGYQEKYTTLNSQPYSVLCCQGNVSTQKMYIYYTAHGKGASIFAKSVGH